MPSHLQSSAWQRPLWLALAALIAVGNASAQTVASLDSDTAAALHERHAQLAPQLEHSPFQRPLALESVEAGGQLQGGIDAVVTQPFALVREQLQQPVAWCEILMLHLNTKQCATTGSKLAVHIGRKHDQPLSDAYRVDFNMRAVSIAADYLSVQLHADNGPFSTRDYRIQLQAVPIDGGGKTYVHLRYAYGYGLAARLAMQGYLATIGADKVGFTKKPQSADYIGGVRGAIERNTMRYYLGIDTYLASLSAPAAQQRTRRLESWFAATEQYARQLHEIERAEYLTMKQSEFRRAPASL